MSATEKYLTYRGEIRALVGVGGSLAFVTTHPEGQAGGFYRLDADTLALSVETLPKGGTALVADGEGLWLSGGEHQVYEVVSGTPKPRGPQLQETVQALAPLADGRLAALVGSQVLILSKKDGKTLQSLDLGEPGTCLAVAPAGRWLAAGTSKGNVAVFDAEGKDEFLLSAQGKLHEGAVTAILFEPDDLRFFSCGADQKLLSTHARGKLEPEDKGRGNNHTDMISALIWGPGERLYSGSRDGTIKSWPRVGGVKPATIKDGVGRVVALAIATVHERPRLVAACDDNTLRVFPLDASGKIGECTQRIYDAYARAKHELSQPEAPRREAELKALAGFGDAQAIELIAAQTADSDHALRLMAAELLAASDHPRVPALLEGTLGYYDEAVRVASFKGLRRHLGETNLRPIDLALKVEKADVGKLAIAALEPLAKKDDQALSRLIKALDSKTSEVRIAALNALESAYDSKSPEANLIALGSKYADVRRGALVRLFRRGLIEDSSVQSALRRASDDADPGLRQAAFLLALHTRPRLLQALRTRDPELQRQLAELEGTTATPASAPAEKDAKKSKGKAADIALEGADVEPLLQASAAQSLDTCLRGARGLATVGDPRAFGLLLQLSREDDKSARAEVCRAMAALDDPRAVERLKSLLHDKDAEVRDAAFTALARLHRDTPLLAAESGLNATHEDIRRRGLQALVAEVRKTPGGDVATQLLARVLNDSFPAIRTEAFKSILGLQLAGGAAGTLRFVKQSIHSDVRREVLNEVIAQVAEPWGLDLLLEFFNDADPGLRGEAFAFSLKKTKGLEFLDAALGSRYPDLRMKAVEGLIKKRTAAAQALLVRALDDEDKAVRRAALDSLVDADALPALTEALANAHPDVRLRAAKAFARHGDSRAFGPLLALVTAPEPEEKERQADWLKLAESAFDGLGELGDPAALPHLIPALDSPHAGLRKESALALARVSTPDRTDSLRQALQHSDPEVRYRAAYGMACLGDASVASLVFSDAGGKIISVGGQIAAALSLGKAGEDRLIVFLDDTNEKVRNRALLLMLMREWKDPNGAATRALACLSSRPPRLRLVAARAIEALADTNTFASFVAGLVNDRGDRPAWKVTEGTVDALAEMLIHGDHRLQVRTARLLRHLDADEQDEFNQAWKVHEGRFAKELTGLRDQSKTRKKVPLQYDSGQFQDLSFGAYVGLVREQASPKGKGQAGTPDQQAIKVRQSALAHLLTLAWVDARHARSALPVFVQALGDPNQAVRFQAFEQAKALGMSPSALAAEALASGHVDLGIKGLELLTGGASEAEGQAVLEQAMLTRKDDLALEAARLLAARLGPVAVGIKALEAVNNQLRLEGVNWLAAGYDNDPAAQKALRQALESRYGAIREAAAYELATKKDPVAYDALVTLLTSANEPKAQRRVIQAIESLGDPRGADALLDRVANDPAGTALADDLIRAAGRFRAEGIAERLLTLVEKDPKRRDVAFTALVMVSGYDQHIGDPEDESVDDQWLRHQHPRKDAVLARMLDRLSAPGDAKLVLQLIGGARWAKGTVVDAPLAALAIHPNDDVRRDVLEALSWRLRKRGGDAEPLRKALGHRDPASQFIAAEGLALARLPDGLNVLLASIDFATDLDDRRRAVLAIGELADERALETLLKLAGEAGHALQEPAAEAIGHLGKSAHAERIFELLERQARGDDGVALAAIRGLRWLNNRAGWQLIRAKADDDDCSFQGEALWLLRFNDDPATRDLFLKRLAVAPAWGWDSKATAVSVLEGARQVFGPDSLEPDYAILQNPNIQYIQFVQGLDQILERVRRDGQPSRIFKILPRCTDQIRDDLRGCLLNRADLPIAEAKDALESPDASTATLAALVLGRAGDRASGAASTIAAAIGRWQEAWDEKWASLSGDHQRNAPASHQLTNLLTPCLRGLVWAAGRVGGSEKVLETVSLTRPEVAEYRPIRREAVLALAKKGAGAPAIKALEAASLVGDAETRAIAAQAVGRLAPAKAESLAEKLLTDAVGFRRLTLDAKVVVEPVLRAAAKQAHYQGVVLPSLIDRGEVATLTSVLEDKTLSEAARQGALEGLGAMALEAAEAVLRKVGSDEKEDEDIRKAAWRSLRRSKRARAKPIKAKADANAKAEVKL
ncbi:HEAT repeat domain-containing protein [Singulisphaera sp. PoT]|uniref:HEAT repeat domain-containing protein n=1 Tax=Singulisphaera sp. PoT TaxID=3411797 RepID=UPI003BF5CE9B